MQCDPCQMTNGIFHGTRTKNFTIRMEIQMTIAKAIFRKSNGTGGISFPDFRLYYTTKLYSSRQYGSGTKTGIQTNGTR